MSDKIYYVYILTNTRNGTLYVGVTSNLPKRILQHERADLTTFVGKYKLNRLVYAMPFNGAEEAITWEKQLKRLKRYRKIELIESTNPDWANLFHRLT